jgi:hypothetical protein
MPFRALLIVVSSSSSRYPFPTRECGAGQAHDHVADDGRFRMVRDNLLAKYADGCAALLVIRREQWAAFERAARAELERRLHRELSGTPGAPAAPALAALITDAVDHAAALGIDTPLETRRYVALALRFGANMADNPAEPWIGQVLRDPEMTAADKLALVADMAEANRVLRR